MRNSLKTLKFSSFFLTKNIKNIFKFIYFKEITVSKIKAPILIPYHNGSQLYPSTLKAYFSHPLVFCPVQTKEN